MSSLRPFLRRLTGPVLDRIDPRAANQARLVVEAQRISDAKDGVAKLESGDDGPTTSMVDAGVDAQRRRWYFPPYERMKANGEGPFMAYSTCSAADVLHPRYPDLCKRFGRDANMHRKRWEFAFIVHHLTEAGMLARGNRGIGFGVGTEPLPAAFAAHGCDITATDAPPEIGRAAGWVETAQWARTVDDLHNPGLCDPDEFRQRVEYVTADMNHIDPSLTGYDFTWSACCFEHLGSLQHGLDFVRNSVEHCLRPGGVAVHTTEFNVSSNTDTFESAALSIYRERDLVAFIEEMIERGHTVHPLRIAPDSHVIDHFVDLPPYDGSVHLKLELQDFVTTSVGIVITRGG